MALSWENLQRFLWCWSSFCCCCCSSFVVFLYLHFLFDIIPHSSVDYSQVFRPILYFQSTLLQSDSRHFHFLTIPLSSYRECYSFEWTFLPTGLFTLHSFPTFWHNLLLSRLRWDPASAFLKVAGFHTHPRNTDLAHLSVWFTVIHDLQYILTSYLCMSILQKFYLWWKLW